MKNTDQLEYNIGDSVTFYWEDLGENVSGEITDIKFNMQYFKTTETLSVDIRDFAVYCIYSEKLGPIEMTEWQLMKLQELKI